MKKFNYEVSDATIALKLDGYYVWDTSVIKVDGRYFMFSSRWPYKYGFGWNWLYNSEVILSSSDKPEGPYKFEKVILPRRGKEYFDGMNTHNTCIRRYKDKFYLYYMGTTYNRDPLEDISNIPMDEILDTWDHKRIGLAIADNIMGPYKRINEPLLLPNVDSWDATAITNPAVAIMDDGQTYMIYKSRKNSGEDNTLKLGISYAPTPEGPFTKLLNKPLFDINDKDKHIEDPFFWYDSKKKKFCIITKDDPHNGSLGFTGEWGSGFYVDSDEPTKFNLDEAEKVYSRTFTWKDGTIRTQCNLERPSVLFDENGEPTHMFFASGEGPNPYQFEGQTYIVCMKLNKK